MTPNTQLTDSSGLFTLNLDPAGYSFAEELPNAPTTWMQTGNTVDQTTSTGGGESATLNANKSYSVTVADGGTTSGINFGNICLGAGGGLTLGFWSNKNGQALETATDFTLLSGLNLVNANGSARDFTSTLANNKKDLNSWLLNATATNMAYMLSAQLAAMELNVAHGFVNGNALIYAPGTTSANALGFATVNAVMAEGNSLLIAPGNVTVAASALRTSEEAVKTALDKANNNLNFVEPDAAHCPRPVFPNS